VWLHSASAIDFGDASCPLTLSHLGCLAKAVTQQCGSSLVVFSVALCSEVYFMSSRAAVKGALLMRHGSSK